MIFRKKLILLMMPIVLLLSIALGFVFNSTYSYADDAEQNNSASAVTVECRGDDGKVMKKENFISFADAWTFLNFQKASTVEMGITTIELTCNEDIQNSQGIKCGLKRYKDNSWFRAENPFLDSDTLVLHTKHIKCKKNIIINFNNQKYTNPNRKLNICIDNDRDSGSTPESSITFKNGDLRSVFTSKSCSGDYEKNLKLQFDNIHFSPNPKGISKLIGVNCNHNPINITNSSFENYCGFSCALAFSNWNKGGNTEKDVQQGREICLYNTKFNNCCHDAAGCNGGAIDIYGITKLFVDKCEFNNCKTNGHGGAIYFKNPDNYGTTYDDSMDGPQIGRKTQGYENRTFFNNCSAWCGGAVASWQTKTNISNATFTKCRAGQYGGAVYVHDFNFKNLYKNALDMCWCDVLECHANCQASGVWLSGAAENAKFGNIKFKFTNAMPKDSHGRAICLKNTENKDNDNLRVQLAGYIHVDGANRNMKASEIYTNNTMINLVYQPSANIEFAPLESQFSFFGCESSYPFCVSLRDNSYTEPSESDKYYKSFSSMLLAKSNDVRSAVSNKLITCGRPEFDFVCVANSKDKSNENSYDACVHPCSQQKTSKVVTIELVGAKVWDDDGKAELRARGWCEDRDELEGYSKWCKKYEWGTSWGVIKDDWRDIVIDQGEWGLNYGKELISREDSSDTVDDGANVGFISGPINR